MTGPIACSLTAGQQLERLDLAAALRAEALLAGSATPSGARLRFRDTADFEQRLEQLIKAESECCPFLSFDLDRRGGELILDVSGPEQARPLIAELFALTTPEVLSR